MHGHSQQGNQGRHRVRRSRQSLALIATCALLAGACATPAYEQTLVEKLAARGITASQNERGVTIFLPDVLFEFDSAELSDSGRLTVDEVAGIIEEVAPGLPLAVEGHADATGDEVYNLDLSIRRAERVAGVLGGAGIGEHRLTVLGLGETRPAASNEEKEGRRRNRRVEIVVIRGGLASGPPE